MKSYEEIDQELIRNNETPNGIKVLGFLLLLAMIYFIFHLLNQRNEALQKYDSCIKTVELYKNYVDQSK